MRTDAKKSMAGIKAVKVDANKRVIASGSSIKPRYWRVNVGKKLTGTRKQRKFFETEREANEFIESLQDTIVRKGTAGFSIEPALAHEALALAKELEPLKVGLTHAVRFFIKNAPKLNNVRVAQVIPTYLKTKTDEHYRKAQAISLKVFARDFGNKIIPSIFPNALQNWFEKQGWQPLNQRNYMRDISMFFKWCVLNDYCMSNPMAKVQRPRVVTKTPPIYSVEEAHKLLSAAKEHKELGLLAFVGFAFFSGVRVEELEKMDWQMVVWSQKEICLPENITKTDRPRLIPIFNALRAWVKPVRKQTGLLFNKTNLRNRKDKLFELAGINSKRNAFRHTFASYHAAHYRNFSELQMILGQRTPSVLFTHYVTATRKEDAERFFALRP
jgi:integrase